MRGTRAKRLKRVFLDYCSKKQYPATKGFWRFFKKLYYEGSVQEVASLK